MGRAVSIRLLWGYLLLAVAMVVVRVVQLALGLNGGTARGMSATRLLIELVGQVVLLLWGARMVQTGIIRAFGADLRRLLGMGLRNRFAALAAGLGVTALLQSSTATALMMTSFAAGGLVALVPGLAVMLGANIGTALIVKLLTFDVSWASALLLTAGYIASSVAGREEGAAARISAASAWGWG